MNDAVPKLSVVIPTIGRALLIPTLHSLIVAEGFNECEVVVAGAIGEGPVLNELRALQERHSQIRHLPVSFPVGDSSEKKNAGFHASRAALVAFLDDDVVVMPDWITRMCESFGDEKIGLVSGPGLVPEGVPLMTRLAGMALASKAAGYVSERYLRGDDRLRRIKWSRIIGCNMVYRRRVLEEIGGFDPAFWPGEEMIAAYRTQQKNHQLLFNADAAVYHHPRQSLWRFCRQIYGYGATRIRLFRGGVDVEWLTVVPALWLLSMVLLLPLAFVFVWARWLLAADLLLYLAADAWITISKVRETGNWRDLLIFGLIPVMHLCYGFAEWMELFSPDKDLSVHGPR